MKKFQYAIFIALFLSIVGFIVFKYKNNESKKRTATYTLVQRKGSQANSEEWKTIKEAVDKLLYLVEANPYDKKSLIALANYMIMEARASGNTTYYEAAALKYINDVLLIEPANFEALSLKALVQLSQHHFADGLATAEKLSIQNPYSAFVYGILVDANVEMGRYDSAVAAAEKMMDIRPDLRSYARASYLREIHGDYHGAVEAMQAAIDAGADGDESTEWSRIQLGQLYENMGDTNKALVQYNTALRHRPGYPYPLAGMARIALAKKDYKNALVYYLQLDSIVNDAGCKTDIAETYRLLGMNEKAGKMLTDAIQAMEKQAKAAANDSTIGHNSDKEMAEAYIKAGNYHKAVEYALAEYNRRPGNIEVNETVAWAYYKNGNTGKAMEHIKAALKTNCKNPRLLCRAGLIFNSSGDKLSAKNYLSAALKNNPILLTSLKEESSNTLRMLH